MKKEIKTMFLVVGIVILLVGVIGGIIVGANKNNVNNNINAATNTNENSNNNTDGTKSNDNKAKDAIKNDLKNCEWIKSFVENRRYVNNVKNIGKIYFMQVDDSDKEVPTYVLKFECYDENETLYEGVAFVSYKKGEIIHEVYNVEKSGYDKFEVDKNFQTVKVEKVKKSAIKTMFVQIGDARIVGENEIQAPVRNGRW